MHYRAANHLLVEQINNQTVILNLTNEFAYSLGAVGTAFWRYLGQTDGDFDAALAQTLDNFEVDEPTLRADLSSLLEELIGEGLIEVSE